MHMQVSSYKVCRAEDVEVLMTYLGLLQRGRKAPTYTKKCKLRNNSLHMINSMTVKVCCPNAQDC